MLNRANLEQFKGALSAATRTTSAADDALAERFVELRPGLLTTLGSPVNHLVTGRRGVGKSTTLALLQRKAESEGDWVIFVDVETHKDRAYPDVLIEIVLEILEAVKPKPFGLKKLRLVRSMRKLNTVLRYLRDAAEEITEVAEDERHGGRAAGIRLTGTIERDYLKLAGNLAASRESSRLMRRTSSRIRRKESYLRDLAPAISRELTSATSLAGKKKLLLVLDDFYFIATDTQPLVLDHLHGITKRSNVWLKIGSVHSRTRSYVEGDPPRGMQPPNDLQHLSLDVGLADFSTGKTFLEEVADGVLGTVGLSVRSTLTETARERAVLVAGGAVSRDYFDLLIAAADAEWERVQGRSDKNADFRISAESIQSAAGRMLERKQTDLRNDAGRDSKPLESRFADLISFARDRDTYFFLVRRTDIDSDWGREIVQLEDLRFVHRIMTVRPNTGSMRRIDTVVFMVDIPALVDTRMQKIPVEFWKPRQSDELRKSNWVYAPGWLKTSRPIARPRVAKPSSTDRA